MRSDTQRALVVGASLVVVVALAVQPLSAGVPAGHDTLLHFYRIPVLNALWGQGIPYSRWSPDLVLGYGYPLFQYYPFLSAYLLGGLYWLVGANAPLAMTVASALCVVLAGWGGFLVGRHLFGRRGGLVAAAAYVLSPHFLYQVYQRGSLSGALAMGLFPFALWGVLRYASRPSARRAAGAALAMAGVFVSHLASALVLSAPLTVLGLAAAWHRQRTGRRRPRRLLGVGVVLGLGLALAAWFWAPALLGTSRVRYAQAVAEVDWSQHFADVLRWPEWPVAGAANPSLAQSPGIAQLVLGSAAAVWAILRALRARDGLVARGVDVLTAWLGALGLGSVFLAVPASAPLWRSVPVLSDLQFPWRCLDAAALLLPVACGSLAVRPGRAGTVLRVLVLGGVVAMFLNALPYVYPPRHYDLPVWPTLEEAAEYQTGYGTYGLTSWGEYLPIDVPEPPQAPGGPGAEQGLPLDAKVLGDLPAGSVTPVSGGPLRADLLVETARPTRLTFAAYWFPGWRARVDGAAVATSADEEGLLTISVPAGSHQVEVYWGVTRSRALADGVSALGLLVVVGLLVLGSRPRRATDAPPDATDASGAERASSWYGLAALGLGVALLAAKVVLLDTGHTTLVRLVEEEGIAGLEGAPWRNVNGELELVGYRLLAPDRLELYWRAIRRPEGDYTIVVRARDMRGATAAEVAHTHPGLRNTSHWAPGLVVRDEYELPLRAESHPMAYPYRLDVVVLFSADADPLPVVDGPEGGDGHIPLGITRLPGQAPAAAPERRVDATFGGTLRLVGISLPETVAGEEPLSYALWWRCVVPVESDYTVFIHLVDADGNLVATGDGQPLDGLYPTSAWRADEVVADRRAWTAGVAAGRYEMRVGLYLLQTGERLPASGPDAHAGDYVPVGSVWFAP